jgi:hypothetical protein
MRKINIKSQMLFVVLIGVITFTSCNDWLTVSPESSLVRENYWKKTEDVNSALAGTYNALRDANIRSFLLGEVRGDLLNLTGTTFGDYQRIGQSNISSTNGATSWEQYYKAINLANTLMYYNKEVFELDPTFTKKMLDGVDAEALFIRSLSYFYLVRIWKEVPLVLKPSISDTSNIYLPKRPEHVIIKQIIQDLLRAKDLAYTDEFRSRPVYFNGRANKYSIMTLLADVYLWNEQYEEAINYCDSVTIQGGFALEPTETWFKIYYPGNSPVESIFEFQYDDFIEDQENPLYTDLLGAMGIKSNQATGVFLTEDYRRYGGLYGRYKYIGKGELGTSMRTGNERDANWIVYRYADINFIKAEALIELDQIDEANAIIGESAARAGVGFVGGTTKELARVELLNERSREFNFEGKRWFDVLRAAKRNSFENKQLIINMILAGAGSIQQQAVLASKVNDTLSYYLPINEHELIYNQSLVQNPYYDR